MPRGLFGIPLTDRPHQPQTHFLSRENEVTPLLTSSCLCLAHLLLKVGWPVDHSLSFLKYYFLSRRNPLEPGKPPFPLRWGVGYFGWNPVGGGPALPSTVPRFGLRPVRMKREESGT
ncbi:hypothetical protein CEXT_712221 [Caerostris extrusa]|uniref:Uncharacterized protein n=1 Tax=Caerostris extrusa TaxID=172846 RepID=A0AAV4WSH8_CAEEX|nr:hypothetical protein CEXT_712221 [Caerostris extrusa]